MAFGDQSLRVISAEDVIAQKLHWYRLGDHVALRETADLLGVTDLLERLLGQ